MVEALEKLEAGKLVLTPQPEDGVDLCQEDRQGRDTHRLDTCRRAHVHNHIRGLSPFPGAWCEIATGGKAERLKLLRSAPAEGAGSPGEVIDERLTVACADGAVRLIELQRAGGRPVTAEEFLRGTKIEKGMRLS